MGLKFRFKNTQMKQKKRLLCGNNGNRHSLKIKQAKSSYHISLIINTKHTLKNLCIHFILYAILRVLRASDVASINSITTVFEQQSNERTQKTHHHQLKQDNVLLSSSSHQQMH